MSEITVVASPSGPGWDCDVEVREGGSATRHRVSVSRGELERFGRAGESAESLVRRSMAFLLEREPKESIMRRFDLTVITRFFPEYAARIHER
jgi:hypothetical protein